jgi:hypothetical protein
MSTNSEGPELVAQRALLDGKTQALYKIGDGCLIITIDPRDISKPHLSTYPLPKKDVDAFLAECRLK